MPLVTPYVRRWQPVGHDGLDEVPTWLAEHYGTEVAGTFDRQVAATDHLIRARRILADDDHRSEMAKLLAA